jgi:hypothetical protein
MNLRVAAQLAASQEGLSSVSKQANPEMVRSTGDKTVGGTFLITARLLTKPTMALGVNQ